MNAKIIAREIKRLIWHFNGQELNERLRHEIQAKLSRLFKNNFLGDLRFYIKFNYDSGLITIEGERLIDKLALWALEEMMNKPEININIKFDSKDEA